MKQATIKQRLANELRKLKPHAPREEIMISSGHCTKETEAQAKQCLAQVKQHIKAKFEQQVSYLITKQNKTRQQAETEAFDTAMFRIESWKLGY